MSNMGKALYEFGPYRLDPEKRVLFRDREPVPLQMKAFETLLALVRHSEEVVLKDELMKAVWPDTFVEEANLTQNISVLRKVLGDEASERRYIVTIPGRGYRFVEKVRTVIEDEIIVVESHARSRVVIAEEGEQNPPVFLREGNELRALPGQTATPYRWWMAAMAVAGTVVASLILFALLSPAPVPKVLRSIRLTHTGSVSPHSVVLSDSNRLYFTETIGAKGVLAEVPATGGDPKTVASSLSSIVLEDIDSTRSRLLAGATVTGVRMPLWVAPTAGGSAQRLGDLAASCASWSPDGQQLAYCREGGIYVAGADGTHPTKLISVHGVVEYLRWSPEGRRLRFTVNEQADGERSLWEASSDGANPHPLALGWKSYAHIWGEGEYTGDWSPDGKYFVFRSQLFEGQSFWAIREKTGWFHRGEAAPVQIYSSPDLFGEPRFSADGKKLFFVGYREQRELVRYDSARQLFVPYLGGIPARLVSFSSDGQWVAYKSDIDNTLWRSRTDGSEKLQLTFRPLGATHSSWSPDGKMIVFQGGPPGEPARIFTIPSNGGQPEILLHDDTARLTAPSWCGDGSAILLMRWAKDASGELGSRVLRLDMTTRETTMLPDSDGFDGVHCSPDGKYAAAADQPHHRLMLFDFSSQRWSVLSEGDAYGWGIRWSADSRYVYYQHAEEDEDQPIFRVRVSDRNVEQITSARQILRADVLSYTMTGLTPDNSPLASLVHRTSDVYALELELP